MTASRTTPVTERCDHCGDPIDTTTWHPAVIERDGDRRLFTFCERECQERWRRR
ncbi:DUF7576 family protein [Natronococcus wangiae]|uniref:DUF7576 family protein n=1 Tax=Natronococcus wangiae TaxID=3068275 RepID=UPI00273F1315|nr:hypothetical protein [Natronococcus sp. AD5]